MTTIKRTMAVMGLGMVVAGGAAACEQVDSDEVATDAIYANMVVTANGDGNSEAVTTLRVGGNTSNTYLELTENDALIAAAGDPAVTSAMQEQENLGAVSYHASFAGEAEDTPFKISFLRTHAADQECNGVSAPNSTVALPAPFAITAPATNASFSRANDDIVVTWAASGETDPMSWSAIGGCTQLAGGQVSGDPGTLTIPAGMIMGTDTSGTCNVVVSLERTREGALDPAYGEGGVIRARQLRSVTLQSTP